MILLRLKDSSFLGLLDGLYANIIIQPVCKVAIVSETAVLKTTNLALRHLQVTTQHCHVNKIQFAFRV